MPWKTFLLLNWLHKKRSWAFRWRLQRIWEKFLPTRMEVLFGKHPTGEYKRIWHELAAAAPLRE